jgi:hypothetical protein
MSNEKKTVYIGNGKKQNEKWLKSSLCLTDIPQEHIFEYNGKKYIKINVNVNDTPNQFGKDVSISVDTYQPEEKKVQEVEKDLPF